METHEKPGKRPWCTVKSHTSFAAEPNAQSLWFFCVIPFSRFFGLFLFSLFLYFILCFLFSFVSIHLFLSLYYSIHCKRFFFVCLPSFGIQCELCPFWAIFFGFSGIIALYAYNTKATSIQSKQNKTKQQKSESNVTKSIMMMSIGFLYLSLSQSHFRFPLLPLIFLALVHFCY